MTEQWPVGIDFGTSTCKMVVHHDDTMLNVRLDRFMNHVLMPSVISFDEREGPLVGSASYGVLSRAAATYPSTTPGHLCVKLGLDNPNFATYSWGGKTYDARDMATQFFLEMLAAAELHLGYMPQEAVLTHPAYFTQRQVKLIREAAEEAGLYVPVMRAEPVAAALAYVMSEQIEGNIAVYDFGGGTFDTTVLALGHRAIQTYSKCGNPLLGGGKLTQTIYEVLFAPPAGKVGNWDLDLHTKVAQDVLGQLVRLRLLDAAEDAKVRLSSADRYSATIDLPLDLEGNEMVPVEISFGREDLEKAVLSLVRGTMETVQEAVHLAGLTVQDIDHVLPVGGVTRMPLIRQQLVAMFGESRVHQPADPDTMAAQGAALFADGAAVADFAISDVLARSLRRRVPKSTKTKLLIGRGTPLGGDAQAQLNILWPGGTVREVGMDLCEGEEEEFARNEPVGTVLVRPEEPLAAKTPLQITLWYDENKSAFSSRGILTTGAAVRVDLEPLREENLAALAPEITAVKMADVIFCVDVSRSFRDGPLPVVVKHCLLVEEQLRRTKADCRFSVLAFADPSVPQEDVVAHPFSAVDGSLRGWLANLPAYDGGDTAEDVPALLRRLLMVLSAARAEAQKLVIIFTDAPTKAPEALGLLLPRLQGTGAAIFVFAPTALTGPSFQFYQDLSHRTGGQFADVHSDLHGGFQKALKYLGITRLTGAATA